MTCALYSRSSEACDRLKFKSLFTENLVLKQFTIHFLCIKKSSLDILLCFKRHEGEEMMKTFPFLAKLSL